MDSLAVVFAHHDSFANHFRALIPYLRYHGFRCSFSSIILCFDGGGFSCRIVGANPVFAVSEALA